ncbi:MAG TPA: methyltransferase, partial [Caulobacteraceae bacterium]
RPFRPETIPADILACLREAGALAHTGEGLKSRLRASTLHGRLHLHSAYPTKEKDAVFFGPDSYRFADFIAAERGAPVEGVAVDIGTGAGVGALAVAALHPRARVLATDINDKALRLARANAAHAGLQVELLHGAGLETVDEPLALVVANPPYIADDGGRTYSDGGGAVGAEISLDWARHACAKLEPRGRLLLYTGSAIIDGRDAMREGLEGIAAGSGCVMRYRELDPDVFGGTLSRPAYREVERIAAVGAVLTRA